MAPTVRRSDRVLLWFSYVATVIIFLVILLGFLDTLTGSALGCGRVWPLCNGRLVPGPTVQSLVEYTHRGIAGLAGVVSLVAVIWAVSRYRGVPEVVWPGIIGLLFIFVQSVVGALALFHPESAAILATHFSFALLAFGGLALMSAAMSRIVHPRGDGTLPPPLITRWAWAAVIYTSGLIYWGTYVAHTNAGAACSGWPLCNGEVWPGFSGLVGIIFIHRLGALGAAAVIIGLWGVSRRIKVPRPDLYRAVHTAMGLVILQIFSGGYLVLSHISVPADLIHVGLATLLFTVLVYAAVLTLPQSAGFVQARGMVRPAGQ